MKPSAVIYDMDGTLVDVTSIRHHVLVEPRNFHRFHEESVDCPPIETTVQQLDRDYWTYGHDIIIVTARSEKYRPHTSWWLADHAIPHNALFMRDNEDQRPDYQVKKDILRYVRNMWDVIHAVDDSPHVLRLWEEEGISTTVVPGWIE